MTILLVHNRYQRPGGEDQVFEAEGELLRAHGHKVVPYEVHNDAVEGMGRLALVLRTLWNRDTVRAVRALIRTHRPDVVHCHNTFPLISPSVFWACRRAGVPVVLTVHNYRLTCLNAYLFRDGRVCERCFGRFPWAGLRYRCYRDSLAASAVAALTWFLHFRLLRTYHRCVGRFIALTEFGRAKLLALGLPEDRVVVKPNLVAVPDPTADGLGGRASSTADGACAGGGGEERQAGGPRPAAAASAGPRVIFVGRLSSEKGVDVLIRAWRLAEGRLPAGACLTVVGDGPERAALEALAAFSGPQASVPPNLHAPIFFAGRQPREEVLRMLRASSVLVLPSLCYETFGIAAAEAFLCGCPVIVSDHGALAELVEDGRTGFRFPPGDVAALGETLVRALGDPASLSAMGRRARERVLSSDSEPGRNHARLLEIYGSVQGSGKKADAGGSS